ncbi:MAG: hypothetical protein WCE73_04630 [Candidatus Angelobacter sp.]
MIERLIENWLVNTGERGYETPFAQLLASEGHRIIQGPVHHPFEHGKDILTFAPDGKLHAYQLKGPDLINLQAFEKIQSQLLALAGAAVIHPSVSPARRADQVFLVTNATLTPPIRDRIEKFNIGNVPGGWPRIEIIEREQLLGRFFAAHGKYLPQTLPEVRTLLELYYSDPNPRFPVQSFAKYLTEVLPFPPNAPSIPACRNAVGSASLLTSYAVSSWARAENHLSVAQAWLTFCITLIRFAVVHNLEISNWLSSYELALEAARAAIASLCKEAAEAIDLVIPDIVDGLAYPSRSLLVCGMLAAYFLSERTLGEVDAETVARVRSIFLRETRFIKVTGEYDVASFYVFVCALEQLGDMKTAEHLMLSLADTLAVQNKRHSPNPLPDPYHDTEQVLLHQLGADSNLDGEEFDGRSYTLHVAIEWLARRLLRQHLARMWPAITRVQFFEFNPSGPDRYLAVEDDEGELKMWFPGQPQSWSALLAQSMELDKTRLPALLWSHREIIPYLPLLLPHRLTAMLANAVDSISANPR